MREDEQYRSERRRAVHAHTRWKDITCKLGHLLRVRVSGVGQRFDAAVSQQARGAACWRLRRRQQVHLFGLRHCHVLVKILLRRRRRRRTGSGSRLPHSGKRKWRSVAITRRSAGPSGRPGLVSSFVSWRSEPSQPRRVDVSGLTVKECRCLSCDIVPR